MLLILDTLDKQMNIAFCCNMAYRPLHALYDCMLRFASVTVNLGPTFLSGALAANAGAVMDEPSCPLVQVTGGRLGFLNFDIYL